MGEALWKGLGRSLWSSQPRLADKCLVPRIGGERPLTPLCKSGSDQDASVSPFCLAVTLFELTVVNNWYIIMVRTSPSALGGSAHHSEARSPSPSPAWGALLSCPPQGAAFYGETRI